MTIRYRIMPGRITSRNDGQENYVDARSLMLLYCVPREECVVSLWTDNPSRSRAEWLATLIPLRPRYDGDYPLFRREAA